MAQTQTHCEGNLPYLKKNRSHARPELEINLFTNTYNGIIFSMWRF